jgi:hypothetical protein
MFRIFSFTTLVLASWNPLLLRNPTISPMAKFLELLLSQDSIFRRQGRSLYISMNLVNSHFATPLLSATCATIVARAKTQQPLHTTTCQWRRNSTNWSRCVSYGRHPPRTCKSDPFFDGLSQLPLTHGPGPQNWSRSAGSVKKTARVWPAYPSVRNTTHHLSGEDKVKTKRGCKI